MIVHQSSTLGLVVTDRNTVAVPVGDVVLSFGCSPAEVDAKIRFLHPMHNFAILSYNPADLSTEVRPLWVTPQRQSISSSTMRVKHILHP